MPNIEPFKTDHVTIQQIFEAQAAKTPQNAAVVCDGTKLTYQELNERANQLARRLLRLQVTTGTLIGLDVRRRVETIVGLMGILKAGCAFVPIDFSYPKERILLLAEDASLRFVVVSRETDDTLIPADATAVRFDDSGLMDEEVGNVDSASVGDSLAYVIYTSGSTGKPNGVMIEHHSVLNLATGLHEVVYSESEVGPLNVALNASLSFDASIKQIVRLLFGDCIHIVPERLRRDGAGLVAWVRRSGIHTLDCTPSLLRLLLDAGLTEAMPDKAFVLVGGEPIEEALWNRMTVASCVRFYNVYGPTECTVDTTVARVESGVVPNIGLPIPNVFVEIRDAKCGLVAAGGTGELWIRGAGVARGYLNRPELAGERFVASDDPSDGQWYRTGDLVCALPNGQLVFQGRSDDQVKLRGNRLELGEVEATVRQHSSVADACAIVREDVPGDQRLAVFIVFRENASDTDELRSFLADRLPEHMLPSFLVSLYALPLTPSGKTDRRALASEPLTSQVGGNGEAPRNPVEAVLCEMCAQILGVERVGVQDNFFELGGHSLLATQFVAQLQDMFPTEEPLLGVFFQDPTVKALAAEIIENTQGADAEKIAEIIQTVMALSDEDVDAMLALDEQRTH